MTLPQRLLSSLEDETVYRTARVYSRGKLVIDLFPPEVQILVRAKLDQQDRFVLGEVCWVTVDGHAKKDDFDEWRRLAEAVVREAGNDVLYYQFVVANE